MPKTSFLDLCRQFATTMAELIERPECPRDLRQKIMDFVYDVQASGADAERDKREMVEVRELLPIYLSGYAGKPRTQPNHKM
jgi:hypothetical protein